MSTRRTRTALFSDADRRRLADAVVAARERAGWPSTADFARAVGRSPRAIYAVENAEPTVGQSILQAVGRTLSSRLIGWTEDTPRLILEGSDAPSEDLDSAPDDPEPVEPVGYWDDEDETFFLALTEMLKPRRLKPTREIILDMRREWLKSETDSDQSNEVG